MGAYYDGQDRAIDELKQNSTAAKEYLYHHLGNSLNVVTCALWLLRRDIEAGRVPDMKRVDQALEATNHAMADVRVIGG